MTPTLRWAAMRAILMFHNCEGQSYKTVTTKVTIQNLYCLCVCVCGHGNLPIDWTAYKYNIIHKYTQYSETKFHSVIHAYQYIPVLSTIKIYYL